LYLFVWERIFSPVKIRRTSHDDDPNSKAEAWSSEKGKGDGERELRAPQPVLGQLELLLLDGLRQSLLEGRLLLLEADTKSLQDYQLDL
jgi:hypothetical protein